MPTHLFETQWLTQHSEMTFWNRIIKIQQFWLSYVTTLFSIFCQVFHPGEYWCKTHTWQHQFTLQKTTIRSGMSPRGLDLPKMVICRPPDNIWRFEKLALKCITASIQRKTQADCCTNSYGIFKAPQCLGGRSVHLRSFLEDVCRKWNGSAI